ncbi:MAG: MEDS domain-containing protein [Desulfovibrionales bacterium]
MDSFNFVSIFSQNDSHCHPHACIIFDVLKSYRRVAFSFIREGLEENEKCIMAVDSYHKALVSRDFARVGLDMETYLQSGRLVIIDVGSSYSGNSGFDPDSTIEIWKHESMKAFSDGFNALRVVGEATFALEGPGLHEKLIYYENIINQVLFEKYPFKSLCAYDKNRYPSEVIKAAIRAHPILFYNEELFLENIHYVPPEIHFKQEKTEEEIDRWLENVRKNNKNLKELKESNERLDLALDFSNEGVWDWNLLTNKIYFSPNWKKLLGYANNEIRNDFSEWERLTKPEHVQKAWNTFEEVIRKKRNRFEAEFQMQHKDGRWVEILSRANVVFDATGKALRMIGTHVDITERKQAEKALAWQARRNKLLSETASRLLQSENPQKIVEDLCRRVMNFLDCQAFFNFLADHKTGRLHLNAYAGIPEVEADKIEWLDYGIAVCGCVARDAKE